MSKYLKNNNGWAMVMVLILVTVLPLLAVSLYMYSSNSILHMQRYQEMEQARYLARSSIDAIVKIWLEADPDDRPVGPTERVYYMANGQFILESDLTQELINDNSIGYIDCVISNISDPSDEHYGASRFVATAHVGALSQSINVITSARTTGNDLGWYNQQTGRFFLGSNVYSYEHDGETYYLRSFDPAGIVTCDTQATRFTVPTGEQVGITGEALFFKKIVDLNQTSASQELTALVITSKYAVFEQPVYLQRGLSWFGGVSEYATLVLNTSENTGVELEGRDGLYSMVYFQGGVYEDYQTVIEPGTAWYVKKQSGGVDLLKWFFEDRIFWGDGDQEAYFFLISPGDMNKVVPTENSLVSFMYE